jgi:hypothetical protein
MDPKQFSTFRHEAVHDLTQLNESCKQPSCTAQEGGLASSIPDRLNENLSASAWWGWGESNSRQAV